MGPFGRRRAESEKTSQPVSQLFIQQTRSGAFSMPGPTEGMKIVIHRSRPQGAYNPTVESTWDPGVGEAGSPLLSALLGGLTGGVK